MADSSRLQWRGRTGLTPVSRTPGVLCVCRLQKNQTRRFSHDLALLSRGESAKALATVFASHSQHAMILLMEKERCHPEDLLRQAQIKRTPRRIRILDRLLEMRCAFSAKDLQSALLEEELKIDAATVYRTLQLFSARGLVRSLGGEGGVERYASTCRHNPLHAHFLCEECGRTYCLRAFDFEESRALLSLVESGFFVRDVSLSFRGQCAACGVKARGAK